MYSAPDYIENVSYASTHTKWKNTLYSAPNKQPLQISPLHLTTGRFLQSQSVIAGICIFQVHIEEYSIRTKITCCMGHSASILAISFIHYNDSMPADSYTFVQERKKVPAFPLQPQV